MLVTFESFGLPCYIFIRQSMQSSPQNLVNSQHLQSVSAFCPFHFPMKKLGATAKKPILRCLTWNISPLVCHLATCRLYLQAYMFASPPTHAFKQQPLCQNLQTGVRTFRLQGPRKTPRLDEHRFCKLSWDPHPTSSRRWKQQHFPQFFTKNCLEPNSYVLFDVSPFEQNWSHRPSRHPSLRDSFAAPADPATVLDPWYCGVHNC